jgi:hypothetical protein
MKWNGSYYGAAVDDCDIDAAIAQSQLGLFLNQVYETSV